ncbi:MAG: histone deacetylase [Epsilonproteobacteria bacterium]|nr:histone deacetylase [Campylobacterota bacterium]
MKKVAWITDDIYLKHDTGIGHPESIDRLKSINKRVEPLKNNLIQISPRFAIEEQIELIHHPSQIKEVKIHSQIEKPIDADTVLSKESYNSALKAVGAGLEAIDGIKAGKFQRAFCAVRPPGHHATPTKSMGFCLFNNIAITARYAQQNGYKKVMIIDFDVHHGNGTQDAFYADDTVFYFSSHQAFAYPGTGEESQVGLGKGVGYTANHPLMPNSTDSEILDIYQNDLPKSYEFFQPDIILVSAGYDLHESDPLAMLDVTSEGIRQIVREILKLGDKPVVFMLEGGYSLYDLGNNVALTVEEMLDF